MESRKRSSIIGYGELSKLQTLIARINNEFKSNPKYQKSANSIHIGLKDGHESIYDVKIDTKYYTFECELHLTKSEGELKTILVEKMDSTTIEGLIVGLDHDLIRVEHLKSMNLGQFKDRFNNFLGLNLLLHLGGTDEAAKKAAKIEVDKLNDEFMEFEIGLDELVDIDQKASPDGDNDEDEEDFSAIDELINCLFVHDWANMELKNDKGMNGKNSDNGFDDKNEKNDDSDDEFSVESLISNLKDLRSKASQLSFEERKQYAEKVVTSFWRSIGGDVNELNDNDDDSS